jgi:hypothetical protein
LHWQKSAPSSWASPTPPGPLERFSFGRGAGWYLWQRGQSQAIFDQLGGPATQMDRKVWCGANP